MSRILNTPTAHLITCLSPRIPIIPTSQHLTSTGHVTTYPLLVDPLVRVTTQWADMHVDVTATHKPPAAHSLPRLYNLYGSVSKVSRRLILLQ